MNPDNIGEILQKGLHVTLGATATLVEAIQDPAKQGEKFSEINGDWNRLAEDLAVKGQTTEQEARTFVDGVMAQMPNPFTPGGNPGTTTVDTVATPAADAGMQAELEDLTQQLAALRLEIENLRNQPDA